MSDFSITKFFRNQYLTEGDITTRPYDLQDHPDIKIFADTLSKMLNVNVEQRLGSGRYNGREGYYIRMPREIMYWDRDQDKIKVEAIFDKINKLTKEYEFEFNDLTDYDEEPGERSWPANVGFFIKEKSVNEMDMNDPVMVKMRAAKMAADKLAKMRADNAGDDGNDKFFDNAKKIAFLKKERAQLMRDMEQEAEPEGGPIADEYGSKLNRIDAAIAKLSGRKEMTYDQAIAEMKVGDKVTFKSGGDDMEIIGVRDMFASDLKAYRVKNADGETFEYSEDQLQLAENALGFNDSRLSSDQHRDLDYAVRGDNAYTFGNDPYADDQLRYKYARKMGFLTESASTEEKRIAMRAIKSIAKYRGVSEDEAKRDLTRAIEQLGSLKEAIKDIKETIELGKNLNEDLCAKGKAYRKKRMAAGEKSSAYLNGRAVKVCKGQMKG